MTAKTQADVEPEIDRLYQAPLDQFVQARNELAARVRGEGEHGAAMRIHSLAKPSISAWAVNQLYWRARAPFEALMRAGQKLRAAQEATLAGRAADVREAGKARDAALVAALDATLGLLTEAGHPPTPAMRLRIATDLDALAAYGGTPPGGAPGRMTEDLDPPGFEVFEGMGTAGANSRGAARTRQPAREAKTAEPEPRGPRRRTAAHVVSFEAIATARRAVADAERAVSEKRAAAHRAADALDEAREAVTAARADEARAKSAWDEAQRRVAQAERRVPECEQEAEQARRAALQAAESVEQARAALERMKKRPKG